LIEINEEFKPECPTQDCANCFFLSRCTKDVPDNPLKKHLPSICPIDGWPMGLLADKSGAVCVICGHKITEVGD